MFKTKSKYSQAAARRQVLRDGAARGAKRSEYDKPFFALPEYMNVDYQKAVGPISPEQFTKDFVEQVLTHVPQAMKKRFMGEYKIYNKAPELAEGDKERYNLYDEDVITFGKYKGKRYADINDEWYLMWLLYQRRASARFIRNLYYYNEEVRALLHNPSRFVIRDY